MKILVFGKGGQLASCLTELNANYDYIGREGVDLSDTERLQDYLLTHSYDLIVNLSAYTAVDKAEEEKDLAFKINAEAVGIMASSVKYFIHVSTDYVFDGSGTTANREEAPTNPINAYGASKLAGEKLAIESNPNSLILRTSWLYSEHGNNFLKSMLRLSAEREELSIVADQIAAPTYAGDLAQVIEYCIHNIETIPKDLYHYCNDGQASWYDFAKAIFEYTGRQIKVNKISTADYPTPAKRPLFSLLDTSKIKHEFNINIPTWQESLKTCLQKISY